MVILVFMLAVWYNTIILNGITLDEFKSFIYDSVKIALAELKEEQKPKEDELMNVDEVISLLKVSKVTLYQWRKAGKLPFYQIGRRVLYKKHEVIASLERKDFMKFNKRRNIY